MCVVQGLGHGWLHNKPVPGLESSPERRPPRSEKSLLDSGIVRQSGRTSFHGLVFILKSFMSDGGFFVVVKAGGGDCTSLLER